MTVLLKIKINDKIFVKDPEQSELGRKIISNSIKLIYKNGFEEFTFKKLAKEISSTEAGIYRYFENKHRLLIYLTTWYWAWLEYQVTFQTNNMKNPINKIKLIIKLLTTITEDKPESGQIDIKKLHHIMITEGAKTYLTRHVSSDNKDRLFKPYKDLCAVIGNILLEENKKYKYPRSLASTIIEMSHFQFFFMNNLPSLTDFSGAKDEDEIVSFLENLVLSSLQAI